jgi:hypothetical protein
MIREKPAGRLMRGGNRLYPRDKSESSAWKPCAMKHGHKSAFSRRRAPELCKRLPSNGTEGAGRSQEGRRENRVPAAPIAPCAKGSKHTVVDHRFTGTPGFPRAMVLTAYFVLSPVTGLFVTVAREKLPSRELDASTGASGPHDFAVRDLRCSSIAPSRPPHPIPRP